MSEYNEMTPAELNLCVELYVEKMKYESEDKLFGHWINAYWQRIETLEPFNKAIGKKEEEKPKGMTPEQMLTNVMQLNEKMKGNVK